MGMVPKAFRGNKEVGKAMSDLATKMLEHGRDHWPEWTIDHLTKAAKGPAPGHLDVAFTDLKRVQNLLTDLKKEWIPRNRKMG